MKKRAALIERARQLRAWLESCPPEDEILRLALILELVAAYEELTTSNK